MTNAIKSARLARNLAAILLLGLAVPYAALAEDAADRSDPNAHVSGVAALDPISVGSAAPRSTSIVTGNPITTDDVDPSLCGHGQLVRNFATGNLVCEWAPSE